MKKQYHHLFIVLRRLLFIAVGLASIALVVPPGIIQAADAGYALKFDGNSDMVELAETVNIIGSGWEDTKSVNLWVKPTGANICTGPDVAGCPAIFEDRPHYWGITIGLLPSGHHAGQDRIWVWNYDESEEFIGIEYTPGEWVNIALVHDGGLLLAYKNGLIRGSVTSGTTLQSPGTDSVLYLGGVIGGDIWLFNGEIDEVRIWNRALSAAEIGQTMHQTLVGNEPGLVAYYQMSDGSGTTLTDDSQFDWNGALLDGLDPLLPSDGTYPLWVTSDAFIIPTLPVVPTNLEAAPTSPSQVDLTWTDNSTNESDFEIDRCSGTGCSDFSLLASVPAGTQAYPDTSVDPATTHCYRVRATNAGGASAYTNVDCATTPDIPPDAPTDLTATATSAFQIDLAWTDNSTNEANFEIVRCTGAGCTNFSLLTSVLADIHAYQDTSVVPNATYCYRVRATNTVGASAYTNVDCATTPDIPPVAPTGLTATEISANRIDLAWTDNSTNEANFEIERCTGVGCTNFSLLTSVLADLQTYQDTSVVPNATYCYRVRATNSGGASAYTNVDCATIPDALPAAPTGLTAIEISAIRIDLAWTDNSTNEANFEIERCTGVGCTNFSLLTSVPAGIQAYPDTSVVPNATYCYRVRATNIVGPSAYTNVDCATTPSVHLYLPFARK